MLRSRSSPVRLGWLPAAGRRRQRSPTVSPPQPSLRGSPFSKIDDLCYYINQESKCPSRKSAYFSKRPPGEPLRVVVLSRDKLNSSNILLPPPPYTDATPSPPPKAHRSRTRQRQNEGRRASCHLVQGLLTDLTDNLPLVPPAPLASSTRHITQDQTYDVTSNTKGAAKALSPQKLRRHRHRVGSAKTGNVKAVPDGDTGIPGEIAGVLASACRNVAVQARARSRSTLDNTTKAARQMETEVAPAAVWMGDVRALRDSHVRLVRRQLRHIAQLNRALDYARYPQSATPPQPGLPMQQTQSAQSSLPTQSLETRPLQSSQSSQLIHTVGAAYPAREVQTLF